MPISRQLQQNLDRITKVRATVFGDFCLDVYWFLDENADELSLETGLPLRRIREQRQSLGGAGNVTANLLALGAKEVRAVGVAGHDIFGPALIDLLKKTGVNIDHFHVSDNWQTMVYAKPHQLGSEQNRLDFGAFNEGSEELEECMAEKLAAATKESDVVILNQQVPVGVNGPRMIERINEIIRKNPGVSFLVDSRHYPAVYAGAVLKLNAEEAARLLGVPLTGHLSRADSFDYVSRISASTGKPAFLTRGEHGIVFAGNGVVAAVDGAHISGPVDTVGAGDTVVAALGVALGSGLDMQAAAELANLAANVTVQKLHITGTATPAEILQAAATVQYRVEEPTA